VTLPWDFAPIRTERLLLRLMRPADLDDVLAYQSRDDVTRYLLHENWSREETAERIEKYAAATRLEKDDDWIEPAIELDGHVIGHVYLNLHSVENRGAEIGWTLHPDAQGKGYAFEAASAVLDLCFGELGLHRVRAELDPRNDASIALCRRLGLREEAHFVQDLWFKGDWADTGVWAILGDEWRARPRDIAAP
jgi:RimJ/RimL family protein N-acetyltransferase